MRLLFVALLGLLQVCAAQDVFWALPQTQQEGEVVFTYSGYVSWGAGDTIAGDSLEWIMTVHSLQQRRDVRSWIVSGYLLDLAFYESGTQPKQRTIVETAGKSQYYICDIGTVGRMADGSDNLQGLVRQSDLILDLPLDEGKTFGETAMLTRSDGLYVWRVESVRDTVVADNGTESTMPVYTVTYRALTSVQIMEWLPGVGIIRYYYHHNGSPSDVDIRLTAVSKQ